MLFIGISIKDNSCFAIDQDGTSQIPFTLGVANQNITDFADWLHGIREGHHECYAMIGACGSQPEPSRRLGMWQSALELSHVMHCLATNAHSSEVLAWRCKWKFEKDSEPTNQSGVYWCNEWGLVFIENGNAWIGRHDGTRLELAVCDAEKLQLIPITRKIGEYLADNDYPEFEPQ